MTNLAIRGYDGYDAILDGVSGRHALSEDAVLTPIFHALTHGRRRDRRPEAGGPVRAVPPLDPVERFRRNPLTAPIPAHALAAVPSHVPPAALPTRTGQRAPEPERGTSGGSGRRLRTGRHHRRLEVVRPDRTW